MPCTDSTSAGASGLPLFRRRGSGEQLLRHPVGSAKKDPVLLRRKVKQHLSQPGDVDWQVVLRL